MLGGSQIALSAGERRLLDLIRQTPTRKHGVRLRIAGGWVRDKLLEGGKEQSQKTTNRAVTKRRRRREESIVMDIDIAVEGAAGVEFAEVRSPFETMIRPYQV